MKKKEHEFNTSAQHMLPVLPLVGPARVSVGPGHYLVWSDSPVVILVDGQASFPVTALRLGCLQAGHIEVECGPRVQWAIKAVQPFDPVDSVPHEALLVDPRPPTMEEMLRQMIRQEAYLQRPDAETFEEADDFDIEDEEDLPDVTQYTLKDAIPEEGDLLDDVEPPKKPGETVSTAPAAAVPSAPAPQAAPAPAPAKEASTAA